jgi:hypothetical protein
LLACAHTPRNRQIFSFCTLLEFRSLISVACVNFGAFVT